MGRLEGKRVVITGAAGGQGRVACTIFAREGARVLANDLNPADAGAVERLAPGIHYVAADLATAAGVDELASAAESVLGGVDVLYNNHGIILGKPFLETSRDDWDRIHDVDLKSVYFLSQKIVPMMPSGGSIINVSSIGGLVALDGMTAYGAAKGGVAMLSRGMALDLRKQGIRVNAICPGVIDTPMPRNFVKDLPNGNEAIEAMAARHIVGRLGQSEEIVNYALFLASDESSFVNGSVVAVDGGWTAF